MCVAVFGIIILAVRWRLMGSSAPTFQLVDNPHSFVNGSVYRVSSFVCCQIHEQTTTVLWPLFHDNPCELLPESMWHERAADASTPPCWQAPADSQWHRGCARSPYQAAN